MAAWRYCKSPNWMALLVAVAACYSLSWINGNPWALAAFPVVLVASRLDLSLPFPEQRRDRVDAAAMFAVVLALTDPKLGPHGSRLEAVDVPQDKQAVDPC